MRVALINQPWGHVAPPVERGGSIPLLLWEMARRLACTDEVMYYTRSRFRGSVVSAEGVTFRYVPIASDKLIQRALRRVRSYPDPRRPMFSSHWMYWRYATQVARDLRRTGCDVAHIINFSQFVPVIRRHNPHAKIVLHMHCEWLNQLDPRMLRRRLEQCDLVLGCSRFITEKARRLFPELSERFATLYNGVDVDRFGGSVAGTAPKVGGPRIVFVGRVTPEKGVHTLIQAFGRVAERHPQAELQIVGPEEINPPEFVVPFCDDPKVQALLPFFAPGAYRAYLQSLVPAALANRVEFVGNLSHGAELVRRYQQADVCVVPSVWEEPFGLPVVEAMAAGAPVVATRGGAFPELIGDGESGLLVERGDAAGLAGAILRLLNDGPFRDRIAQAGRRRAIDLFSWDRVTEDLLRHYRAIGVAVDEAHVVGATG